MASSSPPSTALPRRPPSSRPSISPPPSARPTIRGGRGHHNRCGGGRGRGRGVGADDRLVPAGVPLRRLLAVVVRPRRVRGGRDALPPSRRPGAVRRRPQERGVRGVQARVVRQRARGFGRRKLGKSRETFYSSRNF